MIGAVNSIRLCLVSPGSPPHISRTCSRCRSTAPQPPGPGLGLHPPSVWMTTTSSCMSSVRPCLPEQPHGLRPDAVKAEEAVEIRRQVCEGAVIGVEECASRGPADPDTVEDGAA